MSSDFGFDPTSACVGRNCIVSTTSVSYAVTISQCDLQIRNRNCDIQSDLMICQIRPQSLDLLLLKRPLNTLPGPHICRSVAQCVFTDNGADADEDGYTVLQNLGEIFQRCMVRYTCKSILVIDKSLESAKNKTNIVQVILDAMYMLGGTPYGTDGIM